MARISLRQWLDNEGVKYTLNHKGAVKIGESPEVERVLRGIICDSVAPALCDEGCEVEPDGECEHGCPSILLACGLM